ncbi:MAG: DegV family protein, partial [Ruminococcus sp.]|nr:DegV family protein [Ruminococcus sp.]
IEDKCYMHYPDCRMMSLDEFYRIIGEGVYPKTTQINIEGFKRYFEQYLRAGKDVIYTGIPTGLSGTFNTCLIAVEELREKYPKRKIIAIDSACDSAGLGLLVYMAGKKYREGVSIEELASYIEATKGSIAHWFIVEDLDQLKRGGRISTVAATFGKALQIKPLISCDETGKLVNVGKIRGKSNVISSLVKYLKRDGENLKKSTVFVAHANNLDGAKELRKSIKSLCKDVQICDIGPVIGTHVGSGMLAVVFPGHRNLQA